MPDKEVKTIEDLIFYQYAKIIAKSAMKAKNNDEVKAKHYGFIKNTFRRLKSGEISWSDILREDIQFAKSDECCAYCGAKGKLTIDHIVPKSLCINERCASCQKIQSIHNITWACMSCNNKKRTKGLYTFFQELYPDRPAVDNIPPLLEKKYLKTMYCCHKCAGTLNSVDLNGDGRIDVFDIDAVINLHK